MRPLRFLLAGSGVFGVGAAVALLLPSPALAQTGRASLHDMTCTGIHAMGEGMPKQAALRLTLVDQDNGTTLARQAVRTTPAGTFKTAVKARLNQVASIHLVVARQDGAEIAFADHVMDAGMPMCSLPFTGTRGTQSLLLASSALVALGVAALALARRRARAAGAEETA